MIPTIRNSDTDIRISKKILAKQLLALFFQADKKPALCLVKIYFIDIRAVSFKKKRDKANSFCRLNSLVQQVQVRYEMAADCDISAQSQAWFILLDNTKYGVCVSLLFRKLLQNIEFFHFCVFNRQDIVTRLDPSEMTIAMCLPIICVNTIIVFLKLVTMFKFTNKQIAH